MTGGGSKHRHQLPAIQDGMRVRNLAALAASSCRAERDLEPGWLPLEMAEVHGASRCT